MKLVALFSVILGLGTARAEVKVVATTPALAAIARDVGGARVQVVSLALPTQDPHFVDAKPSLALDLSRADLLLATGLQLEVGWLPTLQLGARNPKIQLGAAGYLDCSQFVRKLEAPEQPVDRSMGDVHPGGNPHYLYDPRAGAQVARGIAARLKELDPAGAAAYDRGLADFLARLDAARAGWEKRLAAAKGQPIVTYHRSWVYLADWLGLEEVATIEPKPGIPPTPGHVAKVLGTMRAKGVRAILREGYYPDAMCDVLAQRAGAHAVLLPGGPDFRGGQTYVPQVASIDPMLPLRADDVLSWSRLGGWDFLRPRSSGADRQARQRALEEAGAAHLASRPYGELSEGQKQRILFARLLATDAELALLDEPTSAMDAVAERQTFAKLRELADARRMAVIVVSHVLGAAVRSADRVLFVDRERQVVRIGAADLVLGDPAFRDAYGDHL